MTTTTRRRLLTAAAAAPLAALPALALAAPGDDSEIVALYGQWCALLRDEEANGAVYHRIEAAMPEWAKPGKDEHGHDWGWPDLRSHPDWERLFADTGLGWRASEAEVMGWNLGCILKTTQRSPERRAAVALQRERERVFAEVQEAKKRVFDDSGMTAHIAASEALCARLFDIEDRIVRTPARGLAGLLVKVRIMAWIEWETQPDSPMLTLNEAEGCREQFIPSIARDVARLAGETLA